MMAGKGGLFYCPAQYPVYRPAAGALTVRPEKGKAINDNETYTVPVKQEWRNQECLTSGSLGPARMW
jgi:hypothetical protein